MIIDHYLTISAPAFGEYKDKASKFLAYAYPFDHEDQLVDILRVLKSEHFKANHLCYAYKIGVDGLRFRANDDGEPSGTAGKPILNQITSLGLTNVLVVVVRHFGGTKLGVPGLIHAYKEATKLALEAANIIEEIVTTKFRAVFTYERMGEVLNTFKACQIDLIDKIFEIDCQITFAPRQSEEILTLHRLKAKLLNKSMEEVDFETDIEWCKIEKIEE
jgi:uncharacterized YigZ family protein